MKSLKSLLVLALLSTSLCFGQGTNAVRDPCQTPNATKQSVILGITTATTTQLIPLVANQSIYVCAFSLTISQVLTTPNTFKLVYGTGASCGTGQVNLTGLYGDGGVTAGIPLFIASDGGYSSFVIPTGNALCATTAIGATGSFQGVLTYIQQ